MFYSERQSHPEEGTYGTQFKDDNLRYQQKTLASDADIKTLNAAASTFASDLKLSFAGYCRERGIDYDQFMYQRDKIKNKLKVERAIARELRAGFAKVHVEEAGQNKGMPQLPDAKWLSEFIHHLMRVR